VGWEVPAPAAEPDYVMLLAADGKRRPSFRALWNNSALGKGTRGTAFGFTSNLPPALGPVRLRGSQPKAGGVGEAQLSDPTAPGKEGVVVVAEGSVPAPKPEARPAARERQPLAQPPPPAGLPPAPLLVPFAGPTPGAGGRTSPGTGSASPGSPGGFDSGFGGSGGGFGGSA